MKVINTQGRLKITPGSHALLDGSSHTDTVAQTVSRGSIIYGNSTPKWDELTVGGAHKFLRADGTDVAWKYPGAVLLATATASASATVDFTLTGWTNGDFHAYLIVLANVAPATDNVALYLRTSTDGGTNYDAGASDYAWARQGNTDAAVATPSGDTADSEIEVIGVLGNAANESVSGDMILFRPAAAAYFKCRWLMAALNLTPSWVLNFGTGVRFAAADVDAIRFLMSSGNIASGEFRLYGIPDAA